MLFSLANIKRRSVRDPDGEMAVVPKLMHGRASLKLLEQALSLFEGFVGRPRGEYDGRVLEAAMGDYRLARCVEACLLTRYSFVQPQLDSLLSPGQIEGLAERGLAGPQAMRLALWDAANERYGGFAPPEERETLLTGLAADWGLPADAALVDNLLALDSEGAAILTSTGEQPGARELMQMFNMGVVQTLLAHATRVEIAASHLPGAALKRLYFVAKRRGVLVEVEQAPGERFSLTLFGPEQAFGSADKYGQRLAVVTLSLFRSLLSSGDPGMSVSCTAHLVLHDRPYRFHVTPEVIAECGMRDSESTVVQDDSALGTPHSALKEAGAAYSVGSALEVDASQDAVEEPSFDSMVEARLYKEFSSLQRQGYSHGWAMQREPEPLLAPGLVLIPDFAFVRGNTRVFMEIAGFWSPSYRERKLAKLKKLAEADEGRRTKDERHRDSGGLSSSVFRPSSGPPAFLLAAPQEAGQSFGGLPFPTITYKTHVKATDALALLDRHFGQREERQEAAQSQATALLESVKERGFIPEQEVAQALRAYTRSELLAATRELATDGCSYVPGVGLLLDSLLEKARASLGKALKKSADGRLPLEDAAALAAKSLGVIRVDIEALAQLWPEWQIERPSLFEAYLSVL